MVFKRFNSATFKKVVMFFLAIFVTTLVLIGCSGKEVEKITLNKQSIELVAGESDVVQATVTPSDAKDKTVTWSSSNKAVATVSNGTITAVSEGEAIITAKAGTKTAKVTVKVNAKTYTVTFNSNGGSPVSSLTVKDGEKAAKPADPIQAGYVFNGWYKDSALQTAFNFTTEKISSDTTLFAKWRINKYTVVFDSNEGSEVPEQEVEYNKTIARPNDPTKDGYVFAGWYSDFTLQTEYNFDNKVTENVNLYAKWNTIVYDVTFNVNGGSEVVAQEVLFNGKAIKPANPTKAGHTFVGWFSDEALTTEYDFNTVLVNDITLYAKWDLNVYTVAFNSNGGSLVEGVSVNHGEKLAKPTDPTLEGYLFKGWFTDAELTTAYDFDSAVEGALTLFAKFEIDMTVNSVIDFELNGGVFPISSLDKFVTDAPVATTTIHELNETAAEYYISATAGSYLDSLYINDKNHTMKPSVWQNRAFLNRNAQGFFEVQLVLGAGSANANPDLSLYEYALFCHEAYKTGYDFLATLQVGQIITIEGFDITSIKEGTLDATMNVYAANANLVTNKAILAKEDSLPVPAKAHHTFLGWYAASDFSGEAITTAAESVKVYAKWEANKVKLSFDSKGGSEVTALDVVYGQNPTAPADPTRVGYTFGGWFKDAEFATAFDFNVAITENTTVYAKWVAVEYDVVYNVDGGTEIATHKAAHDSKVATPTEPTKEGNEFLGWYTEAEFTNLYNFDAVVTGQVNLFAKWATKKNVTVDYAAAFNETLKAYFIKVTVEGEALDATSIKSIAEVRVAGEFITPRVLTPDTDTALWFRVAQENANPNYKEAGVYTFVVVKQDDSVYAITIDYKPESVTALPYEVSFVVDGGSEVVSQIIVKDQVATRPVDPTKAGHNFVGWFADAALTTEFDFATPITAITKVYAKWEAIKYTVTYNLNGGNEFRYKSNNEMFTDFLTDLHAFLGSTEDLTVFMHGEGKTSGFAGTWNVEAVKNKVYEGPRPTEINDEFFASHTTYMEKWLPFFDIMDKYTKAVNSAQTFYNQKSTGIVRLPQFIQNTRPAYGAWAPEGWVALDHYFVTTADYTLPVPSKEGLVFAGWYNNAEFTGDKVTKIVKGTTGDVVLYAKFVEALYNVEFVVNGGSAVATQVIEKGLFATQPVDPTKAFNTFGGWFSDVELTTEYDFNTAVTADLKLYAKWDFVELAALLVDANLVGEAGTKVTVNEVEYTVGGSAYKTFAEIAGKYQEGATITVLKGTYDEAFTVTKNNVKLVGPNKGISALDLTKRVEEAVISQPITVNGTEGLVVDGLAFTGKAQIKASTPVKNFTAKNLNFYDPNIDGTQGLIFFGVTTAAEINDGFTVENSSFVDGGNGFRALRVNNAKDSTIRNNYFKGFYDTIRFEGQSNGTAGPGVNGFFVVEDNKFEMNIQYPIMASTWTATSVEINRNYIGVDPAGTGTYGIVNMNNYQPKEGVKSVVNITNNFVPFNTEWHEFRLNSKGATAAQLEYNVNYNIFNEVPWLDTTKSLYCFHIADHNTVESDFKINGANNYYLYEGDVKAEFFLNTVYEPFLRELPKEKFTVEFVSNDGSEVAAVEVEDGSLLTQPVDPTKADFKFVGWYTDEALTVAYDFNTPVTAGLKLYAKWKSETSTITYNYNGGKLIFANRTEMIEGFLTDLHVFTGATESLSDFMHGTGLTSGYNGLWYSNATYKDKIYDGSRPTEVNNSLFISSEAYMEKWLPFFDIMEKFVKTVNATQKFYGDKATGLIRLNQYVINKKPSAQVTDATMAMMPDIFKQVNTFKEDSANVVLPVAVKEGNKFLGWYDNPEFNGIALTKIVAATTGDITLYARWNDGTTVTHKVTFKADGVAPQIIDDGKFSTQPVDPVKIGFEFQGWFTDEALTVAYDFNTAVTGDVTLYAKWKNLFVEVDATFNLNDGLTGTYIEATRYSTAGDSAGAAITVGTARGGLYWYVIGLKKTEAPGVYEVLGKGTGYTNAAANLYLSYHDSCTSSYKSTIASLYSSTAAGKLIYIPWLPSAVTGSTSIDVTFLDSTIKTVTKKMVMPEEFNVDMVRPGYEFLGWYDNAELTGEAVASFPGYSPESGVTSISYFAKWKQIVKYNVTFNVTGVAAQVVVDGKLAVKPVNPIQEGYTFEGWFTDEALTTAYDFATPVTGDVALYAKWVKVVVNFNVTFDVEGVAAQVIEEGKLATEPVDPTKDGFTFVGWFTDEALTVAYDFATPVTANVSLYAKWEEEVVSEVFAEDLFISEYIEGGGFNKAIEIYNGTGATVDLSKYTLELYSNGETTAKSLTLTGTLAHGEVIVISRSDANEAIVAQADIIDATVINHNGDDTYVLKNDGVVIDCFGQIGTAVNWGKDVTLVRKPEIKAGRTVTDQAFDASVEWTSNAKDSSDNLGSHTVNW